MPELPYANDAVRRGLIFLSQNQESDGSFISYSSAKMWPFRRLRSWRTVFVPALILTSLSVVDGPAATKIRCKLAKFLLDQKSDNWSFNYWSTAAPEYKDQPYPDDLDDTFCSLAGLYLYDSSIIGPAALAKIVKLLIASEAAVGGPYRTWLVPVDSQPVWLDVDLAVNSNITYFLSLIGNRLPRLNDLLGQAIAQNSFTSPYYPAPYAFVYYFARAYEGPEKDRLLKKARHLHHTATNDLDRALCLSARLRLGDSQDLKTEIAELLKGQRRDGSWPAAGFYADPVKKGKLYYNGAAYLSTAFALEALELYRKTQSRQVANLPVVKPAINQKIQNEVLKLAAKQCQELGDELRANLMKSLKRVAEDSNGQEIILLAHNFSQCLREPISDMPIGFINRLGLANLYGWLAYTIYDDFLDEEGKPELISVANVAMRRSIDNFLSVLPDDSEFATFVNEAFDVIDSANAWESAHCRFNVQNGDLIVGITPDYDEEILRLAERSLGHALPSLAVLSAAGKGPSTAEFNDLLRAFRHYLIARQLNDDAHDWPEDLKKGRITPVVSSLLVELKIKPGKHRVTDLIKTSRSQFWHSTLLNICQLMREHIRLSRQSLKRVHVFEPRNVLTDLLDGLEASIDDTLSQQKQAEDFLKQYKRQA